MTLSQVPIPLGPYAQITQQLQRDVVLLLSGFVLRIPAIIVAIVVLLVTRFAARAAHRSTAVVGRRTMKSQSLRTLAEKAATISVWVLGVLLAALLLFPSLRLGDLIATLGLGSVAIGFAFADIFKNFLAGVLLLLNEPFRIGDQIVIETFEGTVERIDLRFTVLRTYRGERLLLPNAFVFTSPIAIRTAYGSRRSDLEIGVVYGSDLAKTRAAVLAAVVATEGVLAEPAPIVDFTKFDDSSIDVVARYWTAPLQANVLRTQSRAIESIDAALSREKIEIAFPTRTIVVAASSAPIAGALDA